LACEVKNFSPENFLIGKNAPNTIRLHQYAIAATDEAIKNSGTQFEKMMWHNVAEVGVIWASGMAGSETFEEQLKEFDTVMAHHVSVLFLSEDHFVDIAAGVISIRNKLHGPNYCTVSACASF